MSNPRLILCLLLYTWNTIRGEVSDEPIVISDSTSGDNANPNSVYSPPMQAEPIGWQSQTPWYPQGYPMRSYTPYGYSQPQTSGNPYMQFRYPGSMYPQTYQDRSYPPIYSQPSYQQPFQTLPFQLNQGYMPYQPYQGYQPAQPYQQPWQTVPDYYQPPVSQPEVTVSSDEPSEPQEVSDAPTVVDNQVAQPFWASTTPTGMPTWKRSYTPLPGQDGCYNRCRPTYGSSCSQQSRPNGWCQPRCQAACNIRPTCPRRTVPQYDGQTMVCSRPGYNNPGGYGAPGGYGTPFGGYGTPAGYGGRWYDSGAWGGQESYAQPQSQWGSSYSAPVSSSAVQTGSSGRVVEVSALNKAEESVDN